MKIYLRLDQYLDIHEHALAQLARDIGVTDAQLKHALEKEPKQVSREVLEKICDFLVRKNLADPADLPGALFGISPENFWHLLCERQLITMVMGARSFEKTPKDQVVIAADSILQANLTFRMTEEASAGRGRPVTGVGKSQRAKQPRQIIDPHLVPAWPKEPKDAPRDKDVIREANELYDKFRKSKGSKALICYGSIKSNPVIESILSSSFREAAPYVSQDNCNFPYERACPFVLTYRDWDPKPPSVCGARKLSKGQRKPAMGMHFEMPNGDWRCAEWTAETSDAALVFYCYDKVDNRLEMVLGGYSSRGTRCLAELMNKERKNKGKDKDKDEMHHFWPPEISTEKLEMGAFVVRFDLEPVDKRLAPPASYLPAIKSYEVFRLHREVLGRRIA